jgi:Protein of unknown function (DUF3748)
MAGIQAILRQRTHGNYGHFLNHRQALSHCGRFLYYDTRNADPDIAQTTRIESLDLSDDALRVIYDSQSQSVYGPGVGAVVCHPLRSTVLFIHGLTNCDENRRYSMTRRFGAWTSFDPENPIASIAALESRSLQPVLPWGTLGGGTHAHSFSSDGRWVSFTYNDALAPESRSVGFAIVDDWESRCTADASAASTGFEEEFQGTGWAALALVPQDPIESAREECWVPSLTGADAVPKIAWIARLKTGLVDHRIVDEIFLAQFPEHALRWPSLSRGRFQSSSNSHGSAAWRLQAPEGIRVQRLTYTESAVHPGVQGPRHWLMASDCGRWIYTLMKDPLGVVRAVSVCVQTGRCEFISNNQESITHPPAIDGKTNRMSYLVGKRLTILDLQSGQESQVAWESQAFDELVGPVQFLKGSQGIFWNARPSGSPWLQIWTATLQ